VLEGTNLNKKLKEMITLNIKGDNLTTRENNVEVTLKGSNVFMIVEDYIKITRDWHVEDYTLTDNEGEGGNRGMNAGAYLNERMSELTGMELRF
jgi:hypothetical protein